MKEKKGGKASREKIQGKVEANSHLSHGLKTMESQYNVNSGALHCYQSYILK